MGKMKLTYDFVKNYIEKRECKLLSLEYVNTQVPLEIECKCGEVLKKSYANFSNKNQTVCRSCGVKNKIKSKTLTFEEIENYFNSFNYKIISKEYLGAHQKLRILCPNLHEYFVSYSNFKQGRRCPICSNKKKKNTEIFKKEIEIMYGKEYLVEGEYVNSHTHINVKHSTCGRKYKTLPSSLLSGRGCGLCANNLLKTTDQYKKEVYKLTKDSYEVLGDYINTKEKIKMKHNNCGNEFFISPNSFLCGRRCNICAMSLKEKEIYSFLKEEKKIL